MLYFDMLSLVEEIKVSSKSMIKVFRKQVNMTRKCHNHILPTNPQHLEEESKKNENSDISFRTQ